MLVGSPSLIPMVSKWLIQGGLFVDQLLVILLLGKFFSLLPITECIHPRELTWLAGKTAFLIGDTFSNRVFFFHCHVSFPGCKPKTKKRHGFLGILLTWEMTIWKGSG